MWCVISMSATKSAERTAHIEEDFLSNMACFQVIGAPHQVQELTFSTCHVIRPSFFLATTTRSSENSGQSSPAYIHCPSWATGMGLSGIGCASALGNKASELSGPRADWPCAAKTMASEGARFSAF